MDILTEAPNADEAATSAQRDATSLTSILSYLANGPVDEPRLVLLHEVGSDDSPREYHYLLPDTLGLRSTTRIGTTALNDLLAALHAMEAKPRARIERALHWHSVALGLDDPLERLQAVMNAFEALNPLLATHLGIDNHETRTCKSCGAESQVPVAAGVHAWLRGECGESVARNTRELRNGLVHGFKDMQELYSAGLALLDPVEHALLRAIAVLVKAAEIYEMIAWPPLAPSMLFALALHGSCSGPVEAAYFTDGLLPEFEPTMGIKSPALNVEEDRATVELEHTGVARLPAGVTVQILSTTMAQDAGARLESAPTFKMTRGKGQT